MSVQLALYKSHGNWVNRFIRWWTGSPYSHCELVINGTCYSSSVRDGGVNITDQVIAGNLNAVLFSYSGTGLSSISAATLPTLKFVNVSLAAQLSTTSSAVQTAQTSADVSLVNNIT
jgi:hypothetical protein